MTDTKWQVLEDAYRALRTVVATVPGEAWQAPTPCSQWSATQVLQHAAGDQVAYASKLTDGPGPSFDPFAPSGALDGSPSALLEPALTGTAEAFAAVDPSADGVPVPLPPFAVSAQLAAGAAALDAAVHAW
ncbi:MAG: maleylpyruvate isomerase N-terminal domain-containing protein, partial [Thermocrispum sp.]